MEQQDTICGNKTKAERCFPETEFALQFQAAQRPVTRRRFIIGNVSSLQNYSCWRYTSTIAFITTTSSVSISTYKEDCPSPEPPATPAAVAFNNRTKTSESSRASARTTKCDDDDHDDKDDDDDERNGTEEKDTHLKAPSHCHNSIAGARLPVGLFCMSLCCGSPHDNDDDRPTDLNDNYLSTPSTAQHSTQCISISCSSPSLANNFLFYFGFFPPLLQLSWLVAKREKSQRHLVVCSQYSSNTVHPPPAISNNTIRKKHAVAGDCEQNNGHQRQDKTDTLLEEGEY